MRASQGDGSLGILVLGVHGSGTSAVAGALHHLGVWMGDRLVGANRHNPRGHFEDADFRCLLYAYRSDPTRLGDIRDFLESRYSSRSLWGLKEPAILEVVNELGDYFETRDHRVIATDRDRMASARSYVWKWPSADTSDVLRLHDGLRSLRSRFLQRVRPPTLWVQFDDLTRQPGREVGRIKDFVFEARSPPAPDAVRRAVEFIDPGLNHRRELDEGGREPPSPAPG